MATFLRMVKEHLPLGLGVLLMGCQPPSAPIEERYRGEVAERCAVQGLGQTWGPRPNFELVLTTEDDVHYRTNIPICQPDAVSIAPGTLELVETECLIEEEGRLEGEYHLTEGELVFDGDDVSVFYRWTGPGFGANTISVCEVDGVLMRVH